MANLIQPTPEPSRSEAFRTMRPFARRTFPGRPEQVAYARAFVRQTAGGCPQIDNAVLLTSELCANAVRHSASGEGGTFEVAVAHGAGSLRVEVRDDGSPIGPGLQDLDSRAENGRGLAIVATVAHSWGEGRCLYFELRCGLTACGSTKGTPPTPTTAQDEATPARRRIIAGQLIAAADQLTEADFDVRGPNWSEFLTISNVRGARCQLTITPRGTVRWDYHLGRGWTGDQAFLAGVVLSLLAPDSDRQGLRWTTLPRLTFKGLVGRALADSGMDVELKVLNADQWSFDAYAEIRISNPALPGRGVVWVSDDCTLLWECQVSDAHDDSGLSLADIVATVVSAIASTRDPRPYLAEA